VIPHTFYVILKYYCRIASIFFTISMDGGVVGFFVAVLMTLFPAALVRES